MEQAPIAAGPLEASVMPHGALTRLQRVMAIAGWEVEYVDMDLTGQPKLRSKDAAAWGIRRITQKPASLRRPLDCRVRRSTNGGNEMAKLILHRDGAYNVYTTVADGPYNAYTTVADGPCYESALTLEQLQEAIRFEGGQAAINALPARLARAHATGCSSIHGETLDECIACNRAGPNGAHLSVDEFVKRYLTLNAVGKPTPD